MDRYSRNYDDRYRGYYDRPRSDTYRPAENYRSERDYRDTGSRNYSPNPHYSSSRSPGHGSSSGSRGDRYYSENRPYSSHYSSRGPSPSRSSSRSPRRYNYYRSGYSYNRRSPSPVSRSRSSSRRRDSYDHRPYGSPSYPSSYRTTSNNSYYRRHYSSYSNYPNSGYHSREPSVGPSPLQQFPIQKSIQSTPTSTAPNSPKLSSHQEPITIEQAPPPQKPIIEPPPPSTATTTAITTATSTTTATAAVVVTATTATSTTSTTTTTTNIIPTTSPTINNNSPTQPSSTGNSFYYNGPTRSHSGPPPAHHANYHPHYYHSTPVRQRVSWAPEQEKEMERYHVEQRKLCEEENKILINCRKSRFELELADWEGKKLDHQLELVQKQWEENSMDELVKEEAKFMTTKPMTLSNTSFKLMIL